MIIPFLIHDELNCNPSIHRGWAIGISRLGDHYNVDVRRKVKIPKSWKLLWSPLCNQFGLNPSVEGGMLTNIITLVTEIRTFLVETTNSKFWRREKEMRSWFGSTFSDFSSDLNHYKSFSWCNSRFPTIIMMTKILITTILLTMSYAVPMVRASARIANVVTAT